MNDGNKAKTASTPAAAILAVDTRFHEYMGTLLPFKPELGQLYATNEAARSSTAQLNASLQAGYFILAVRARGLAAGPMRASTPPPSTPTSSPTASGSRC